MYLAFAPCQSGHRTSVWDSSLINHSPRTLRLCLWTQQLCITAAMQYVCATCFSLPHHKAAESLPRNLFSPTTRDLIHASSYLSLWLNVMLTRVTPIPCWQEWNHSNTHRLCTIEYPNKNVRFGFFSLLLGPTHVTCFLTEHTLHHGSNGSILAQRTKRLPSSTVQGTSTERWQC